MYFLSLIFLLFSPLVLFFVSKFSLTHFCLLFFSLCSVLPPCPFSSITFLSFSCLLHQASSRIDPSSSSLPSHSLPSPHIPVFGTPPLPSRTQDSPRAVWLPGVSRHRGEVPTCIHPSPTCTSLALPGSSSRRLPCLPLALTQSATLRVRAPRVTNDRAYRDCRRGKKGNMLRKRKSGGEYSVFLT